MLLLASIWFCKPPIACENSEVLPEGSVAVDVITSPYFVMVGSVTVNVALPVLLLVVTVVEPR